MPGGQNPWDVANPATTANQHPITDNTGRAYPSQQSVPTPQTADASPPATAPQDDLRQQALAAATGGVAAFGRDVANAPLPEFSYDLNGVNPASDLDYNAFLRGYGYDKSSAVAQAARQRASLQAQLDGALPQIGLNKQAGLTNALESSAARGATNSSSRLGEQNNVASAAATQEAALRSGIADQQARVAYGLQDTVNNLDRQKSEQDLSARERLLQQQNQQVAIQRAIAALGYQNG
jgi:hypothetical protein